MAQPTQAPSDFHHFQHLPTELKMMIWRVAGSAPRVVYIQSHPAEVTITSYVRSGDDAHDPHPTLQQVDYLSRRTWSEVHDIRLEIQGASHRCWSYSISDNDIVVMSLTALWNLVLECRSASPGDALSTGARDGMQAPKPADEFAPGSVKTFIDSGHVPVAPHSLRGDIGKITRLLVHDDDVPKYWPNLLNAPDIRAVVDHLERAFPRGPGATVAPFTEPHESELGPAMAQVGRLPERYPCSRQSCADAHHVSPCRYGPNISVSSTPLSLPAWLETLARNDDAEGDLDLTFRHGVKRERNALTYNDITLWYLSQPV